MRSPRPLASRLLLRRFSSPPPKDLNFSISANYPYPSSLPPLFTDLSSLSTSSQFIAASRAPLLPTLLHKFYTTFSSASDFSINGELDIYPLHLFNTPQLQLLLSLGNIPTPSSVLDIGAGVGNVTASFSALTPSPKITCTETSPVMADRLRSLGYETLTEDITHTHPSHTPKYDLISMLNVLDRTPEPASLLDAAHALLRPDGHILLATPLPFRPFYFTADHVSPASSPKQNSKRGKPLQTISLPDDSFDAAAHTLITEILPKHNFEVVAFSRLPYISGGDFFDPYTSLDDIILCARKKT